MQADQQQQWQGIMQMSGKLQQLSVDQDWSGMLELEALRKEKMELFFANNISLGDAEGLAAGIRDLLNKDLQLLKLVKKEKLDILGSVQKITSGRKAIRAYGDFQE